jgi:hypothetical protein
MLKPLTPFVYPDFTQEWSEDRRRCFANGWRAATSRPRRAVSGESAGALQRSSARRVETI